MRVVTKEEFESSKNDFHEQIINGAIFIYPTDTIYGIGCNAENSKAVAKIRRLKNRKDTPFSVIAPSKEWIAECCTINGEAQGWIDRLPGPLTIILKKKKEGCVANEVSPGLKTLGVRMPKNWFLSHVQEMEIPIITTSANKHGEPYMTSLDNLDSEITKGVDFLIYEGEKRGKPSKLVDLSDSFKITKR